MYFYNVIIRYNKERGKKIMKKSKSSALLEKVGSLAISTMKLSANSTSGFISHQPKLPKDVQKFKKK